MQNVHEARTVRARLVDTVAPRALGLLVPRRSGDLEQRTLAWQSPSGVVGLGGKRGRRCEPRRIGGREEAGAATRGPGFPMRGVVVVVGALLRGAQRGRARTGLGWAPADAGGAGRGAGLAAGWDRAGRSVG